MIIDPPSGWKYGFPRRYVRADGDIGEFLVKNGYPRKDVDFALRHLRMIPEGEDWSGEELEIIEHSS